MEETPATHKHPKVTRLKEYLARQQVDAPDASPTPFQRVIDAADTAFRSLLSLANEDPEVRAIFLPLLANVAVGMTTMVERVSEEDGACGDCGVDFREAARTDARLLQLAMREFVESLHLS